GARMPAINTSPVASVLDRFSAKAADNDLADDFCYEVITGHRPGSPTDGANVITTGTSHADMELLRGSGDSVSGRRGVSFRDGRRVDT
ncbi:MAG: hypothetical protein Q7N95_09635, partial [Alphaproteobacteria bacterium]|nr:hypothetical protein [Alphaproteobacteria bacterium]